MWIRWVHIVYIKEEDWWVYEHAKDASSVWKAICHVRDKLKVAYQNHQWLGGSKKYIIKEGYKWLNRHGQKVYWHHWVWNNANLPKHAFIAWLTALGKL